MTEEQLRGVDVSSHQRHVDWLAVAASGISFAFTKATGGGWYSNPYFDSSWQGARAAGLARGAYHYAFESSGQAGPGPGPEAEAEYFLSRVLPRELGPGDMLVLDIEECPAGVNAPSWALAWCRRVEAVVGFQPLIYTGAWFCDPHQFATCPELAAYPLWLAAYQTAEPPAPPPWTTVVFWQFTADGMVPGISGPCDVNRFLDPPGALPSYGKPAGATPLPVYDWRYPAIFQEESFDCSETSLLWALRSWGLPVEEQWLEDAMLDEGVMSAQYGLMDASGAQLAEFVNRHWGYLGYEASNLDPATFDQVATEAGAMTYPLAIGGRHWGAAGHWSGCRNYDASTDRLELANPAPGYDDIEQTMSRAELSARGPFSLVRVRHPEAEAAMEPDYSPWENGEVGSGLLSMMREDGTLPAQRVSTWLPLGVTPSDVEECLGTNGVMYRWALTVSQGWRYRPS